MSAEMDRFRHVRDQLAERRQAARDHAWHDPEGYSRLILEALQTEPTEGAP